MSAPTPDSSPLRPPLRIKVLDPRASLPKYQTQGSAGLDLAACLPDGESITIAPGSIAMIRTGFAMAVPLGFEAQVRPRSGLGAKHGITLPNAPGTIDSDYRGEVLIPLINLGREPFTITHGLRIAQMVIAPVAHANILPVDHLDETPRGTGGFGSTGTR
jgi:dUTP pyrophosphatase